MLYTSFCGSDTVDKPFIKVLLSYPTLYYLFYSHNFTDIILSFCASRLMLMQCKECSLHTFSTFDYIRESKSRPLDLKNSAQYYFTAVAQPSASLLSTYYFISLGVAFRNHFRICFPIWISLKDSSSWFYFNCANLSMYIMKTLQHLLMITEQKKLSIHKVTTMLYSHF